MGEEMSARLQAQMRWAWWNFAPAILACQGDVLAENATLLRPGIMAARDMYVATARELDDEASRARDTARHERNVVLGQLDLLAA